MRRHASWLDRIPDIAWFAAILTALMLLSWVKPARAVDADLRAGVYTDPDAVGLGAGILSSMSATSPWYFNPNIEVALADERQVFSMNGDFHYDFAAGRNQSLWFGGGPALLVTDRERGDGDVDLGINALAGFGAVRGGVRPYAQLKGTVANDSRIALMGGVRF